ncbi:hypothetical protein IKE67_04645 [bacterium]|nr:hypothetical protein [bacterium]
MEINKLSAVQSVQTEPAAKKEQIKEIGLKEDTFSKSEVPFNREEAENFLLGIKNFYGVSKFVNPVQREKVLTTVEKEPEKWSYVQTLAPKNNISALHLNYFLERDKETLDKVVDLASINDKFGNGKFYGGHIVEILGGGDEVVENAKALSHTDLDATNIVKAAKEKGIDCKKVAKNANELSDFAGKGLEKVVFARDAYSKGDYTLTAMKPNNASVKVILDKNMNKYAIETVDYYESNGKRYAIRKSNDYRNNTVSKVRYNVESTGRERPLQEVRILKDKNGKVQRTEYTSPSDVKGVMNVTYKYPDGRTEVISSGTVDKKTGITTIKKNMVSPLGTKTEYLFEDDPQGNRLSDYKITDKNGNVLLQNSETFEVVDDNTFISSKNGKKYEIKSEPDKITVTDMDKPERKASFAAGYNIIGDKEEMFKVLKKMPGEELFKMKDNIKTLEGTKDVLQSFTHMDGDTRMIYSGDDLFIILHELGHAVDKKDVNLKNRYLSKGKAIFEDKQFNEIYEKEKEAFNKQYPDAQRNHISYFIDHETHYNGEEGGRRETIAESNALLTTARSHEVLAMRSQYLQQNFPETIAYLDKKLNEGKQVQTSRFGY